MRIIASLRRRLSTSGPTAYACRLCSTRFESRPRNCHACGSTAIEEA